MTIHPDQDQFLDIRTYDIADPVLGGISGQSNEPVQRLADRTLWLRNRLGRMLGQRNITASGAITTSDKFYLLKIVTNTNLALTLPAVSGFAVGDIIKFKIKITAAAFTGKAVSITPNGSEKIEDGSKEYAVLYAHDGEEFNLIAGDSDASGTADYWELSEAKGNFEMEKVDGMVRVQPRNSLLANGSLVNRADFPRLWAAVSAAAIADAQWSSDPLRYREMFSDGNGTTTFRLPDMRSMVWKGLDLGRGISLNRLDNIPGGFEADAILDHKHKTDINPNSHNDSGSGKVAIGGQFDEGPPPSFYSGGPLNSLNLPIANSENLIKTAGFIPVIFY